MRRLRYWIEATEYLKSFYNITLFMFYVLSNTVITNEQGRNEGASVDEREGRNVSVRPHLPELWLDVGAVSVGRLAALQHHQRRAGNALGAAQLVTQPLTVQTVQLHRHLQGVGAQTEALAGMGGASQVGNRTHLWEIHSESEILEGFPNTRHNVGLMLVKRRPKMLSS